MVITNNTVSPATTNDLENIKLYTQSGFDAVDVIHDNELNFVRYTFTDIDITSYETVTTDTDTVFAKDGVYEVGSSAIAAIKVTKNGVTQMFYGTSRKIKAGVHFQVSLAGKFYYFEGQ